MIVSWANCSGLNAGLGLSLPLLTSIIAVSAGGVSAPTFTRTTVATFPDFEGRTINVAAGEARFKGSRYVKNLITNTQTFAPLAAVGGATFTAQNAIDPLGGSNAGTLVFGAAGRFFADGAGVAFPTTYAFSVWVRSTAPSAVLSVIFIKETATDTPRGSVQFTPSTTWQRIYVTGTTTGANCRIEIGNGGAAGQGTMLLYGPQLENIAGQTYQQSQEFQSVALLAAPYQGLNVDGAKAYATIPATISIWGDSLSAIKMPNGVRSLYEIVPTWVYDGGVGGDTSTQIRTRMIAAPTMYGNTTVIWAGRNNYTAPATVKADIAAMIAALGHNRYIVLSILNGDYPTEYLGQADYNTIIALNADLAALYPNNFLDVRNPLVALYDSGNAQDLIDHGRDIPPTSIRIDNIHLTPTGYNFVAAKIKAFIDAAGWSVTSAAIPSATLLGYLSESGRTNNALWARDFTNAAWVKTTMTAALDQAGIDGKINGASSLLATGANATANQTIALAAVNRPFSVYVKRLVGVGNIDLAQDGAAYTTQAVANDGLYHRVSLVASQLNPVLSIRLATNGDKIAVDFAALESGAAAVPAASSAIATTAAAVTRNGDILTYALAGNADNTVGTAYAEISRNFASNVTDGTGKVIVGGDTANHFLYYQSGNGFLTLFDGATATQIAAADAADTVYKVASRWAGAATALVKNAGAITTGSFDGNMNATAISIGEAGANNFFNGCIRNVMIWNRAIPDVTLLALTS